MHAAIFANNESLTIQYWQNSISSWITSQNQDGYWNDWNVNSNSWGTTPTYLADGNGNRYGTLTGSDDDRGNIYFWGSMVQRYRGLMFRNTYGPYNITPGIGMDKHYTWDDNLRCNPPVNAISAYLYGCTDPNASNYNEEANVDDGSCFYCDLGDVNCDGSLNVLDIVISANMVLADEYDEIADMNEDGELNILDLVIMVNLVLYGEAGACIDIDGNVYETVQIGEQVWMAENLKVTHYNDGSEIPNITNDGDWGSLSAGAYGVYNNDPLNADIYGNLYNWYAVDDDRGVCPSGWHIPSDEEFMELEMYLGMSEEEANSTSWRGTNEGSKLAGNSDLWNSGDLENNSEFGTSGFSAFPAGYRSTNGFYYDIDYRSYFWSSSEFNSYKAWYRYLFYSNSNVSRFTNFKHYGFSIRCLGN